MEYTSGPWTCVHTGCKSRKHAGVLVMVHTRLALPSQIRFEHLVKGRLIHVRVPLKTSDHRHLHVLGVYQKTHENNDKTTPQQRQQIWQAIHKCLGQEALLAALDHPQEPTHLCKIALVRQAVSAHISAQQGLDGIQSLHAVLYQACCKVFPRAPAQPRRVPWQTDQVQAGVKDMWQRWRAFKQVRKQGLRGWFQAWKAWKAFDVCYREHQRRCKAARRAVLLEAMQEAEAHAARHNARGIYQIIKRIAPKQDRRRMQLRVLCFEHLYSTVRPSRISASDRPGAGSPVHTSAARHRQGQGNTVAAFGGRLCSREEGANKEQGLMTPSLSASSESRLGERDLDREASPLEQRLR